MTCISIVVDWGGADFPGGTFELFTLVLIDFSVI